MTDTHCAHKVSSTYLSHPHSQTVNFASPEILRGEVYRAPHAEVWALGCILSVLLTGKTPFPDSDSAKKGESCRVGPP